MPLLFAILIVQKLVIHYKQKIDIFQLGTPTPHPVIWNDHHSIVVPNLNITKF